MFFSNVQSLVVDIINQNGVIDDVLELEDSYWKRSWFARHTVDGVPDDEHDMQFCNTLDEFIIGCINVDHERAESIVKFMFLVFEELMPLYEASPNDYIICEKIAIDSYLDDLLELYNNSNFTS